VSLQDQAIQMLYNLARPLQQILLLIRWRTGTSRRVDFVRHVEEPTLEDSLAFILSFDTLDETVHGRLPLK
jgi:hypothetical protein